MRRALMLLAGLAAFPAVPAQSQSKSTALPLTLEVAGGGGITMLNRDQWLGTSLSDWNQGSHRYGARVFLAMKGISIGAEVARQRLYWAQLDATWSYAERTYEATVVGALVRIPMGGRLRADLGVASYMFASFSDYGGNVALGYFLPLGPQLELPITIRADAVSDKAGTATIAQATVGLSYRLH